MLPATIARQLQLEFLDLNRNVLESIPEEIGALRDLRMVDVSHNKLAVLHAVRCCDRISGACDHGRLTAVMPQVPVWSDKAGCEPQRAGIVPHAYRKADKAS
jgi:hypothetical protein